MIFRSRLKWEHALPIALAIIILIPILIWNDFYMGAKTEAINWPIWLNVLPIVLAAIILLLIFIPDSSNSYIDKGFLRLTLSVESHSVENRSVSGQLMGEGAGRYRAQGYKVILYAKTDIWYIESHGGMGKKLGNDCSWSTKSERGAHIYAAFLVKGNYQPSRTIVKTHNTDLPPLSVDGEQIVTWMLWSSTSRPLSAEPEAKAVHWLIQQMTPNDIVPNPLAERAGLIIGYQIPKTDGAYRFLFSRSWLYDNAVAAIGLITNDNLAEALMILKALSGQIQSDGKFGFSYNIHNDWYSEDYRSGTIAWVGYAFVFYQQTTGDVHVQPIAKRIAHYLLSLQDLNPASPSYGSFCTGPGDSSHATEHNIIAYFFLRDLGRLVEDPVYTERADLIRDSLLNHHWNQKLGRFDQMVGIPANGLVEVGSLGALFSLAIGDIAKARASLNFVEETYKPVLTAKAGSSYGLYENRKAGWSQGSLQMAMAYQRIGDQEKPEAIINEIVTWQDVEGGIPYAMPGVKLPTGEEYPEWPSVAGTAWLLIALSDNKRFLGT